MPKQELTNWCWAAVTVSITTYVGTGKAWTQCAVATLSWHAARKLANAETCCGPEMAVDKCDKEIGLTIPLTVVGVLRTPVDKKLEFSQVADEIRAGSPIACHLTWKNSRFDTEGHFVALAGYRVSGLGRRVRVHDSNNSSEDGLDTFVDLPYEEMFEYGENQGVWDYSYLIGHGENATRSVSESGTDR